MVKIVLHKLTKDYVQYKFYPNGRDEKYGIVQVNLNDYKRVLIRDIEDELSMYKGHAWRLVEQLAREGRFPQVDGAMWY